MFLYIIFSSLGMFFRKSFICYSFFPSGLSWANGGDGGMRMGEGGGVLDEKKRVNAGVFIRCFYIPK